MQHITENASGVGVACLKSKSCEFIFESSQTDDKVSPVAPSLVLVPEKSLWTHLSLRLAVNATVGLDHSRCPGHCLVFMVVMTLCLAGE